MQGKEPGEVYIKQLKYKSLDHVWLFATPQTCQAPLSMNFPGKNTGVGSHSLLQKILPTQGPNPGLPHCRQILYCQTVKQIVESERVGTFNVLSGNEGKRRSGWQRMRWLDSIINSVEVNLSKLQEIVKYRGVWHAAVHGVAESETTLKLSTQVPLISASHLHCHILFHTKVTHIN